MDRGSGFSQPNELGPFAGTTVVLALALYVSAGEGGFPRLQHLTLALGGLVALVALALSRGAWIGTGLALLVAAALVGPVRRVLLAVVATSSLVLLVLAGTQVLPEQVGVIGSRASLLVDRGANPYDERPVIWAEGLRQVREHPWAGVAQPVSPRPRTSRAAPSLRSSALPTRTTCC